MAERGVEITPRGGEPTRRAAAVPLICTANGLLIEPGEYGKWLAAVVSRFGKVTVSKWTNDPPQGWGLDAWLAKQRARALDRAG